MESDRSFVKCLIVLLAAGGLAGPPSCAAGSPVQCTGWVVTCSGMLLSHAPPEASQGEAPQSSEADQLIKALLDAALHLASQYPARVEPLYVVGLAYQRTGKGDRAAQYWRECLSLNPQYAEASLDLADVHFERGEYEEALACYQVGARVYKNTREIPIDIGKTLVSLGRLDEAVKVLEAHETRHPGDVRTYVHLGKAYSLLKQYPKAKETYEKALRLEPEDETACYGMATVCARLGHTEDAAEYRRRFASIKASSTESLTDRIRQYDDLSLLKKNGAFIYMKIGVCYEICGNDTQAQDFLKKAARLDEKNTECRRLLAILYQRMGRPKEAMVLYEEMVAAQPKNAINFMYVGSLAARLGQVAEAESAYRQVIALAPGRAEGYEALAGLFVQSGHKVTEAKGLATVLVKMKPTAQSYYILGAASLRCGDRPGARVALEKALDLDPGNKTYEKLYLRILQLR